MAREVDLRKVDGPNPSWEAGGRRRCSARGVTLPSITSAAPAVSPSLLSGGSLPCAHTPLCIALLCLLSHPDVNFVRAEDTFCPCTHC